MRCSSSSLAYLLPCTTCSTCSFAYSIARALWTNHSIFLSRFFVGMNGLSNMRLANIGYHEQSHIRSASPAPCDWQVHDVWLRFLFSLSVCALLHRCMFCFFGFDHTSSTQMSTLFCGFRLCCGSHIALFVVKCAANSNGLSSLALPLHVCCVWSHARWDFDTLNGNVVRFQHVVVHRL